MAITKSDGSATIGTTEFFLASNSTTQVAQTNDCIMQPFVDLANMAAGDQYQITVYEKINGGTQRSMFQSFATGAQPGPEDYPALILTDGWEVGVKKIAGTDRTIAWSLRQVA